jgi:hypothetical protein
MPLSALLPALALAAQAGPALKPAGPEPASRPAQQPPPAAAKPARVVVGDFVLAGAAHPDLARVLSDAAAKGVEGTPGLSVMGQAEIAAILGHDRLRYMLGCTEEQGCMTELGRVLEADRLISGSLTLLERTALLTVRFIDVRRNVTLARTTGTLLDATEAELVDAARRLAHEAVTGRKLDTTGTLRVNVSRTGADVTLDGKSLGASPVAGARRVLEGPHTVTVQKAGYVRWSSTVAVAAGQDVSVDVELVPVKLLGEAARSRLWTWGFVSSGVAVAAGSAGIVFGRMASSSYHKYQAATDRSTAVDLHDQTQQRATVSNVSWGIAAAAALAAGGLLTTAAIQDARAANDLAALSAAEPRLAAGVQPLPGGAALSLSLSL